MQGLSGSSKEIIDCSQEDCNQKVGKGNSLDIEAKTNVSRATTTLNRNKAVTPGEDIGGGSRFKSAGHLEEKGIDATPKELLEESVHYHEVETGYSEMLGKLTDAYLFPFSITFFSIFQKLFLLSFIFLQRKRS